MITVRKCDKVSVRVPFKAVTVCRLHLHGSIGRFEQTATFKTSHIESSVVRIANEYFIFSNVYTSRVTEDIAVSNVTLEDSAHRKYDYTMCFVVTNEYFRA